MEPDKISLTQKEKTSEEAGTISNDNVEDVDGEVSRDRSKDIHTEESSENALGKQILDRGAFNSGDSEGSSSIGVDLIVESIDIQQGKMEVPLYNQNFKNALNLNLDKEELVTIANAMMESGTLTINDADSPIATPINRKNKI